LQSAFFRELNQQPKRFGGNAIFRVVKVKASSFSREALAPPGVIRKKFAEMLVTDCFEMR